MPITTATCDEREWTIFATLLLTGLREEELCFLTWADVELGDLDNATVRVRGEGKEGFSPKDYEERAIPIPRELAELLKSCRGSGRWSFRRKQGIVRLICCSA